MVETYLVSTTLAVEDRLTPAMRRAAAVARELLGELDRLKDLLGDLGATGGAAKIGADLAEVNTQLAGASRNAALLGDELRALQLTPGIITNSDRLARSLGASEKRAWSLKAVLSSLHMPHLGMNLPTGIGAGVAYGVYREAEIQHLVNRVMLAANERVLGPDLMLNPLSQQVRDTIREATSSTGMSVNQAGDALMPVVLQMGGLPLKERLDLAPMFEKFGFIEHTLKDVDPGEASQSLVGLLHMTGSYSAEAMEKLASSLAYVSTISPQGLPSIERMASYAMPSAVTAGIDPSQLLLVLANAQSAGVSSTKAGTWFDALFRSMSPKGGLASMVSSRGGQQRLHALEELGLVKSGKLVGMEMLEKGNWVGFSRMLATNLAKIPEAQRLGVEAQATGSTQAARALNLLAQAAFTQNLPALQQQMKDFLAGGLDGVIKKLGEGDPTIAFRKVMADFTNVLMDLGKVVLPPLTAALRGLDDTLKKLIPSLPGAGGKPFDTGDMLTAGAAGAAIGGKIGGWPGAAIGATIGAATVGNTITQRLAIDAGVVIDPTTGMGIPINLNALPPSAKSHGAGALGEWFDGFDWSKLNPFNWFVSSAHAGEMPGGIAGLATRAGMAPPAVTPREAATARPGTALDPRLLKALNEALDLLGAAKLKLPTQPATAGNIGTALDPNVLKALTADLDVLGMKAGGAGAKAKEAIAGLDAFSAAIGRLQMAVVRGVKVIGDAATRLPSVPGAPGRQDGNDPGHAQVVAAIDRLGAKLPARVVMDGRVVGRLVGDRIDREAASWPADRDNFDPGQMAPSAGSGNFYNT